jgi:predicted RNase H-like HicB family nuclease
MNKRLKPYKLQIEWSEDDGGFVATFPKLKGLLVYGDTIEEAVKEIQIAADAWLAASDECGYILPEP